jgi:hypothetical protein
MSSTHGYSGSIPFEVKSLKGFNINSHRYNLWGKIQKPHISEWVEQ